MNKSKKIITRFAPSPTGYLTLGNYRTAIFNFLFTKQNGGNFILRIEDTDKKRSEKKYEDDILESFKWLDLKYDKLYRQSDRGEIYEKYLNKLLKEEKAYTSTEVSKESGEKIDLIRFKNPNKKVTFTDIVRGEVSFDTEELGDFIIAKNIKEPLYHLAVVIDDFEMEITHIIRGEDHISNTARQILIQESIGAQRPEYAHLPLILASDRSKLSKRNGAISIKECREKGFLPQAVINYLTLLGWHPEDDREIFNLKELLEKFKLEKVQKGGAVFDEKKFKWINKEHLKMLPEEEIIKMIKEKIVKTDKQTLWDAEDDKFKKILKIIIEKVDTLGEIKEAIESDEFDYFWIKPDLNKELINWKNESLEKTVYNIERLIELIKNIQESKFDKDLIKESIWDFAEKEGRGSVLWPMRYSLTGKEKSPDPFTVAEIVGKDETLNRLNMSLKLLK